jgi:hypothetical protein
MKPIPSSAGSNGLGSWFVKRAFQAAWNIVGSLAVSQAPVSNAGPEIMARASPGIDEVAAKVPALASMLLMK